MSHGAPREVPSLYAAFDRYPSPKGAAVHIREFAATLFDHAGGGLLFVLGGDGLPAYQLEAPAGTPTTEIVRFTDEIPGFFDRVRAYGDALVRVAAGRLGAGAIVHVRDPWSGIPLVRSGCSAGDGPAPFVYEVNGLPSIELPYAFPNLGPTTLRKLRRAETELLAAADAVLTPSRVLADRLAALGTPVDRITVIPNGATVPTIPPARPATAPDRYIVYVGALQPWQGIDAMLAALARLADLDVRLVICSATPEKRARPLKRLAERLGVDGQIDWRFKVPHAEVAGWLAHAELSLAPLDVCSRNVDQGCCPLKVLESMAVGTCVVASDLAVTRELITDGQTGRLVPASRPAELARAVRVALELPDETAEMGARAHDEVVRSRTWQHSRDALRAVYATLTDGAR